MSGRHHVVTLIKLAKSTEETDPLSAARYYLEAANTLLTEPCENQTEEKKAVELAQKMYAKAKELENKRDPGHRAISNGDKARKETGEEGFAQIGGLEELKEEIKLKIIEPLKNPELFSYYGKSIGGGILMYGPPGCGKTLIAKATAEEAQATFVHVKGSDLKSKYVGETEKNIAELFAKAREKQPAILFFDEFEALGRDRSEGQTHEKSAAAQLLVEMDGMESKSQQILLLAATNEPWVIDTALLREGRFGTKIFVPPPDVVSRMQILQLNMKRRPTEDIDFKTLALATNGFSGADLKAVCEYATDSALKESLKKGIRRRIGMDDMKIAITKTKPMLGVWFTKAKRHIIENKMEDSFPQLVLKADEMETSRKEERTKRDGKTATLLS